MISSRDLGQLRLVDGETVPHGRNPTLRLASVVDMSGSNGLSLPRRMKHSCGPTTVLLGAGPVAGGARMIWHRHPPPNARDESIASFGLALYCKPAFASGGPPVSEKAVLDAPAHPVHLNVLTYVASRGPVLDGAPVGVMVSWPPGPTCPGR
jgi:hypothetical protein